MFYLFFVFAEHLGGKVTDEWRQADFLVGDDAFSAVACAAVGSGALLFSSNFVVQCVAQERLVNAGPFILHQTVQRDDDTRHSHNAHAAARTKKKGAAADEEQESEEIGDLIAELELMSSPEASPVKQQRPKKNKDDKKKRQKSPPPLTPPAPAPAPTPIVEASSRPLSGKKAKKSPVNAKPTPGSTKKKGVERRLDEMDAQRVEVVLAEFEDFVPNVDGASVSMVQFRGK